jgi:GNAT superfamily N-acetyltransferase
MQRIRPVKILKGGRSIAHRYRDGIVEVFREAFAGPPYFEGPEEAGRFSDRLVAHAEYRGFRVCLALDPGQLRVLGFAYGYTVPPDSWWWDTLAAYLSPNLVRGWLEDAFETVQLAVLPAEQGRGIGSALHDGLLEGVAHRRAVLSQPWRGIRRPAGSTTGEAGFSWLPMFAFRARIDPTCLWVKTLSIRWARVPGGFNRPGPPGRSGCR